MRNADVCASTRYGSVLPRMYDERGDRRHADLLDRAVLLLPHDRQRRRDDGGDRRDVRDQARHEEQRAAQLRVVPDARLPRRRIGARTSAPRCGATRRVSTPFDVPQHGRRRVGVVAVQQHLQIGRLAAVDLAREPLGHRPAGCERRRGPSAASMSASESTRRHLVEVGRTAGRPPRASRLSADSIAILHGQRHVADVEVQRVAEQEQEEHRNEQQNQQAPPIAADLPQFLERAPPRCPSCRVLRDPAIDHVQEDVLERRHDRRGTVDHAAGAPPAPRDAASIGVPALRSTACTAVPNRLVFSTNGSSRPATPSAATGSGRAHLDDRTIGERRLQLPRWGRARPACRRA